MWEFAMKEFCFAELNLGLSFVELIAAGVIMAVVVAVVVGYSNKRR
jgi:hypothetical protein